MKKLVWLLLIPSLAFSTVNFKEKLEAETKRTKAIQNELSIYSKKNIELTIAKGKYQKSVNDYDKALIKSKNYIKYISFTDKRNGLRQYYDIRIDNYAKSVSAQKIEFKNKQLKQNIRDIMDLLIIQVPDIIIGLDDKYNVLINEEKL